MTDRSITFTTPDGNTALGCAVTYRPRGTIDAMQWDGSVSDATRIIDWVLTSDQSARYHDEEPGGGWVVIPAFIALDRPNGVTDRIVAGDFVAKLGHGFVKADRDTFDLMYEASR